MWLASKYGFYSVVSAKGSNLFMVRARVKKDLVNLKKGVNCIKNRKIRQYENSDYPFRIFISGEELSVIMVFISKNINYSNFKNEIADNKNQEDKLPFYSKIWSIMFSYQYKGLSFYEQIY